MATSKLQREVSRLLSIYLGKYTIRENLRPDWLRFDGERLELDFYIEELSAAIEVQGEQHYHFVPIFHHDQDGFKKLLASDQQKKRTCDELGIKLFEISCIDDAYQIIERLLASQPVAADFDFTESLKRELSFKGYIKSYNEQLEREKIEAKYGMRVVKSMRLRSQGKVDRKKYIEALSGKIANIEKRLLSIKSESERCKLLRRLTNCKSLEKELNELHLI